MKIKSLLIVALIAVCSSIIVAQSVSISPRKITYKRPKPLSEYKKSFVVNYPKVGGLRPALARKIETAIGFEKNFQLNIREEIREIQWLEEAGYDVNYNKNGILGIVLYVEGSGAYPSNYSKSVVVNLQTGARVKPQDVFIKLNELVAKGKNAQKIEIQKAIIEIKKENPDEENPAVFFEDSDFTLKNLDEFSIGDQGITFWHDYGFPHVIRALQPEGRYFFSWAELKPFIRRDGLLAKFIR